MSDQEKLFMKLKAGMRKYDATTIEEYNRKKNEAI